MLHDLDYEIYPDQHCIMAKKIIEEERIDPLYIHAMQCHEPSLTGEEPQSLLEKTLYTVDELTGLHVSCIFLILYKMRQYHQLRKSLRMRNSQQKLIVTIFLMVALSWVLLLMKQSKDVLKVCNSMRMPVD